jgi:hypothetical protein
MTKKKDLFIGGWVGVGQLLVAVRQTVQCSSVYLLLNRLKWQILKTCMVRQVATRSSANTVSGKVSRQDCI